MTVIMTVPQHFVRFEICHLDCPQVNSAVLHLISHVCFIKGIHFNLIIIDGNTFCSDVSSNVSVGVLRHPSQCGRCVDKVLL